MFFVSSGDTYFYYNLIRVVYEQNTRLSALSVYTYGTAAAAG